MSLASLQRTAAVLSADVWDDRMPAELDFNNDKQNANRIRSMMAGTLLPQEVRPGDADIERGVRANKIKLREGRFRAAENKKKTLSSKCFELARGHRVYLHSLGSAALWSRTPADKCEREGIPLVDNPIDADVIVTANPGNASELLNWSLFLSGGIMCTPEAFVHGAGLAITFNAAVAVGGAYRNRVVWLSRPFQVDHPDLCSALRRAMGLPQSRWREVDRDGFQKRAGQKSAVASGAVIGIVAESQAHAIAGDRFFFTPSALYTKLVSVSRG